MPREILMPSVSSTQQEGKLSKWLVRAGDEVSAGDLIAEIKTDNTTMDIEASVNGTIAHLLVSEGETNIPIHTPIAVIIGEGETWSNRNSSTLAIEDEIVSRSETSEKQGSTPSPARLQSRSQPQSKATTHVPSEGLSQSGEHELATQALSNDGDVQQISMREALREAMCQEMRRDPDVFLMGEEVAQNQGAFKISHGLVEEFGDLRVIDTPTTEHGFAGVGIGASFAGLKPIVEFMTWNFAMQAIDQIINSAMKTGYMSGGQINVPIVFRGPNGAASRVAAQHSQCFSAWYAHCPGLKVIAPSTPSDAMGLLKSAIRDPNPIVFLENENLYGVSGPVAKNKERLVPIGKATIARPGRDVTIVSFAHGMTYALEAAEILERDGILAEVVDLRTLRPLDIDTVLASVAKTHRLVTVEEAWPVCSIGSEICAQVAINALDQLHAPPRKVTGADVPMPYAANLETLALPTCEQVVEAARAVLHW
ncbi:MAG: pyruvate dehydrogenase complex E1 component subunit beta [Hyphomicrobiaceae bacterium]